MSPSKPVGPYTPVFRAGDWLVVSGQVGLADGALVRGGVQAELRQALANLRSLLEAEGASLNDVVKTTVFLRHIDDYGPMNEARAPSGNRTPEHDFEPAVLESSPFGRKGS